MFFIERSILSDSQYKRHGQKIKIHDLEIDEEFF
jgi:hypothetical protein